MDELRKKVIELLGIVVNESISGRSKYNRLLRLIGDMHLHVMVTSFTDDEQKEAYALLDQVSEQMNRGQRFRIQKVVDCIAMDLGK